MIEYGKFEDSIVKCRATKSRQEFTDLTIKDSLVKILRLNRRLLYWNLKHLCVALLLISMVT